MQRRKVMRQLGVPRAKRSFLAPLVVGLGIWIGFPADIAYQDVTSLVSGAEAAGQRWSTAVERAAAGSVHTAELPFSDAGLVTGSISGAGISARGMGVVAFRAKSAAVSESPDEDRVNRAGKRGRVARVAPVALPRSFRAGAVSERTGSLLLPGMEEEFRMAFAVPDIKGQEVEIASAVHLRSNRPQSPAVPAFLASLVTNDRPDVLATAYAPPAPDFASASPFASLLVEEDENAGRFIPPIGENDHAWMSRPLPPEVFSDREQQCLAEGIYFEARGESVKGQAAVAQVILNRVRNPAYPSTICGVVYQNRSWRNRCQFSFACDGTRPRVASRSHYKVAEEVGMAVTAGKVFLPEVGSATHYHATYVNPRWSRAMHRVQRIGLHIFYRTRNGGWS